MDTSKITRVVVVGEGHRLIDVDNVSVSMNLQDNGRTVKIFLRKDQERSEQVERATLVYDAFLFWKENKREVNLPFDDFLNQYTMCNGCGRWSEESCNCL